MKPILVIGPPRSGTSITAKVIQEYLGTEFPFEANRHAEPREMGYIFENFLNRHGKTWEDRFYFPNVQPDVRLISDVMNFIEDHKNDECVIKFPLLTYVAIYINFSKLCRTVFVCRKQDDLAKSLMYHKKLDTEYANKVAKWNINNFMKAVGTKEEPIVFLPDKDYFANRLLTVCENKKIVGQGALENAVNKHWDQTLIEYYRTDEGELETS